MTPRHMAPRSGLRNAVAAVVTVAVLFAACLVGMACTGPDDNVRPADCGEMSAPCEGQ